MANDGIFLALGGLLLLSIFRRPGAGAPAPGGQIASLYGGGGAMGDFAADATLRADEASGVGKGYLLDAGLGADGRVTTNLTVVPMLQVGPLGDYVKVPEKAAPKESQRDEDIGTPGFLDLASIPKVIVAAPVSVPVIAQEPVEVALAYGQTPGTFQLSLDRPITAETPLRLTQVVDPGTGIITKAGFGPKGTQGFTAQNIGVLQAAMAGYGNINEYRAAVAAGEV